MPRKDISFPSKDAALRDDVHTLGNLVGEVLRDQGGDGLFDEVEGDRQLAIRRRDGDPAAKLELLVRTGCRGSEQAADLIRAFTTWFQVVNMAEKVHRVRRRREYLNDSSRPQPAGLSECFQRLHSLGFSLEQTVALLGADQHRAGVHGTSDGVDAPHAVATAAAHRPAADQPPRPVPHARPSAG